MKKLVSRCCELSRGFRPFFIFCTILALTSFASASPGQLTVNPSSVNFGNVPVGNSLTQSVVLSNSGGSKITINQASVSGAGFAVSGLAYPVTVNGGQSISCNVTFTPPATGTSSGSVAISLSIQASGKGHNGTSVSSSMVSLPVSGTGISASQLIPSSASLGFGSVLVGASQTITETLTNSGTATVTISAAGASGAGFSASALTLPITLNPGQSASFNVTFSPASSGNVSGNLGISSDATNSALNVPLTGIGVTPGQITSSPPSLSFGSVNTGTSASLVETLSNSGGSPLTISQITPSGTGFSLSGINLPLTLGAAQSVTLTVSFAPQAAGSISGSLAVISTASNPTLSVPLAGTGTLLTGQLTVTPSTMDFGNLTVGTTQNLSGTISASNAAVTVSSVGVSGSQFSVSGISLPVTIAAGSSVAFAVTFAPQSTGSASANVTFAGNAANSPSVESLTGSATAPQHSVNLGWNTSTSVGVIGYNIYRAAVLGGPYTKINSALDATPYDTDNSVQAGQTYYYVVTAVDSTGVESGYSNQVQALIPTP